MFGVVKTSGSYLDTWNNFIKLLNQRNTYFALVYPVSIEPGLHNSNKNLCLFHPSMIRTLCSK